MATGIIKLHPTVQELVNLSGSRTTGDGTYILDVSPSPIHHYNQIHIHQSGRMVEMNIVTTLNGPMSVGTFYSFATTTLKPIYTIRAEGYGAQSTSDYAVQEGIVSINAAGTLSFTPYAAVTSSGTRTFRFNIVYMLSDDIIIGGGGISNSTNSGVTNSEFTSLEERVSILETVESGTLTRSGSDSYATYKRCGNVVTVYVFHKTSTGTVSTWTGLLIGTLPTSCRPTITQATRCVTDRASSSGCMIYIPNNGKVYIEGRYCGATESGDILQGTITYTI